MKNSTYIKLLTVIMVITVLSSCKKSFLNKQPLDQLSSQTFWKSATDAQLGLAGVYASLKNGYFGYQKVYFDCLSDNAYHTIAFNYNGLTDLGYGYYYPINGVISSFWANAYQGISASNIFLQNIGAVQMDATLKAQEIAEVRFLRAFYYFNLVNRYGDVILYKEPPTLENSKVAKTPKTEVMAFIKSDLDYAIATLPDLAYNGHVVKGTALALQAKIALTNNQWSDAVTAANQIITSGKFSLYSNYQGLFFKKNQDKNPEIMFATQYLAPNDLQGYYNGIDIELGAFGAITAYQEMVDSYETITGKMISETGSGYDPAHPLANRDPRLHASIKGPGQNWYNPDGTIFVDPTTQIPATPYQVVKYIDSTLLPINYGDINKNDESIIHFRYADILLTYAEAKNEVSGPDASVYAVLNQIRQRAGMPVVDQSKYGSQTTLRDFIRHERRIELAFEGQRYDDLVRWKIADKIMPLVKPPGDTKVAFSTNFYLWPIPQHEISINSLLTQNPGY